MDPSQQQDPYRQPESQQPQEPYHQQSDQYQQSGQYQSPDHMVHQFQQSFSSKPGKVQAIAILCLIDGVLSIMIAGGLALFFLFSIIFICLLPLAAYPLGVGIYAIYQASKLLSSNPTNVKMDRTLPILQIINVLSSNVVSLVTGILTLVWYDDPEVQQYYASLAQRQSSY